MEFTKVICVICLIIVIAESAIRCVNEDCKRKKGQESPKIICRVEDLHEDSRIISVHTLEYRQQERCIFNETYGFYVKSIWISGRCRGDFEVCFRKEFDDDVTSSPPLPTTTRRSTSDNRKTTIKSYKTTPMKDYNTTHTKDSTTVVYTSSSRYWTPTTTKNRITTPSNVSMTIQNAKRKQNITEIAGILGAIVGSLIFLVLFVTVVVVAVKRSPCFINRYNRQHLEGPNGHKSVGATISMETTVNPDDNDDTYDSLDLPRDTHVYKACQPITVDNINTYMSVYDSLNGSESYKRDNALSFKYSKENTNPKTEKSFGNDLKFSKSAENKDQSETSKLPMNQFRQYTILDPAATGFHKGVPVSTNYELAKPTVPGNHPLGLHTSYELARPISDNTEYNSVSYERAMPIEENTNCMLSDQTRIKDDLDNFPKNGDYILPN